MITAIPMKASKISNHFKKAPQFLLLNQAGKSVGQMTNPANPASGKGCSSIKELMAELQRHQVNRVVVRNIGERMLKRLLSHDLEVWQTSSRQPELASLAAGESGKLARLARPQQGRASVHHMENQSNHSCCSRPGNDHNGNCCGHDGKSDSNSRNTDERPEQGQRRLRCGDRKGHKGFANGKDEPGRLRR